MPETFRSRSEADTRAWAGGFAARLRAGDAVALHGDLGAGKTVICVAIARALGFAGDAHSPSYALVHEYALEPPLYHLDLYRLPPGSEADWEDIGLEHYFGGQGICLVEWPERLGPRFAGFTYRVEVEGSGAGGRLIRWERIDRT